MLFVAGLSVPSHAEQHILSRGEITLQDDNHLRELREMGNLARELNRELYGSRHSGVFRVRARIDRPARS